MSKIAFIYPGQGAQAVGMGKDFYEKSPLSRTIFDQASEAVNLDLKKLCFEENDLLDKTEYTQVAMVTACLAMTRAVESMGLHADMTAGLSLGEYCAIAVAGGMCDLDAKVFARVSMNPLKIPYVANINAEVITDCGRIEGLLVEQVSGSVRWQQSVETMIREGVDTFVEIGPGKTLTGFLRKIDKNVKAYHIGSWEEAVQVCEELK